MFESYNPRIMEVANRPKSQENTSKFAGIWEQTYTHYISSKSINIPLYHTHHTNIEMTHLLRLQETGSASQQPQAHLVVKGCEASACGVFVIQM